MVKSLDAAPAGAACLAAGRQALFGLFLLVLGTTAASAELRRDTGACRDVTAAVLAGEVEAGVAVLNPDPPDREEVQRIVRTLSDGLRGYFKGKEPRLERSLPDIAVGSSPASLQIWSFGDREVYFVGCHMLLKEGKLNINLELQSTAGEVAKRLRVKIGRL
jgi:hypothetical protein